MCITFLFAYAGYMAKQMLKMKELKSMVTTLHGTDITGWKSFFYKPAVSLVSIDT
jgi:hypothetical protein